MKKLLLVFTVCAFSVVSMAQSEKYTNAMSANLSQLDSAKTADDFFSASASFERIAEAEKTQWLPYYYAAYTQCLHMFLKNDAPNNDQYADKIEALIAKADALSPNNSELSVLKSMAATGRMLVNPQQRYQTYGQAIADALEASKSQDPTNPRPYFMQGQNLRYTPEQFGGGCATAKPVLEEAVKKYDSFKPASALHPNWGKKQAIDLVAGCK